MKIKKIKIKNLFLGDLGSLSPSYHHCQLKKQNKEEEKRFLVCLFEWLGSGYHHQKKKKNLESFFGKLKLFVCLFFIFYI